MEQYILIELPDGMAAVPNLDYLLQRQYDFQSAVVLGVGLILGVLFAFCVFRWGR